ncbi:antibiotic biosynthesis monooxygenase [Streptomyces sp. NPDC090106]|uniref:antibiotic biosynthesis monooxygenase n=1 Tax=Streptomyces sp. NPDC090106 TaxID=3365946 RepID=UPI003811F7C8
MTTRRTDEHPDPADPRVGAPLFSTWRVGTPERQRLAVAAIARAWERRAWPARGLLSYHVYAGEDGTTLLHHSRWTDEAAFEGYRTTHRDERVEEIDSAVPGIESVRLDRFRHYRSAAREDDPRVPGCVVIVDVEFDGPDPERQRAWVDAVFEALDSDPQPPPGGIGAHFHLNTDGTRVLNYAEWESARAHREALAAPGDGIGSATAPWERVRNWPGVRSGTVRRYEHVLGLIPAT